MILKLYSNSILRFNSRVLSKGFFRPDRGFDGTFGSFYSLSKKRVPVRGREAKEDPYSVTQIIEAYEKGAKSASKTSNTKRLRLLLLWGMLGYLAYNMLSFRVRLIDTNGVNLFDVANNIETTFGDVKGCDEVKKELQDIVNFLKNPEAFNEIGAKLPKGVLLSGPPGVGKTLLARAVAGEADVPFIFASGSSFEGIFVGTGANKVKQLFELARKNAPCVIFLDEIDSIGQTRTSSAMHPYANQTINQLLAEMDGFEQSEGIIVLGATNKYENLDKAVTRPGRFDSHVQVSPPNYSGRLELFKYYVDKIKTEKNSMDVEKLAMGSVGYTGADIQNLINQAAINAVLNNRTLVNMDDLWLARDKILMGPEKRKPDDELTNKIAAYHEAGHALVAHYTKDATPIHKVTIIPRGGSGGHTSFLPDMDQSYLTKSQLLAQLDTAMGGRVGEEIIFGPAKVTTGASSDFSSATRIASNMVIRFGFSEKVGPRVVYTQEQESLLSPETRHIMDQEVDRLLSESLQRAKTILEQHSDEHKFLAEALLKKETLTKTEVEEILKKKPKLPDVPVLRAKKSSPQVPPIGVPTPTTLIDRQR